ncbi:MAG TPA: non-ribosomal peptide synthetase, partial [Bryobacteraceae bacterium]|nr:non-ribosomal peptide synthetase [Bryobacteraceae bacterium]
VQEMLTTWCGGGTLIVAPEDSRRDPSALAELLERQQVERVFLPYVMLEQLATAVTTQGPLPSHLAEIVAAGEQLRISDQIIRLCAAPPAKTLTNMYGPTESHVATSCDLVGPPDSWPELPSIGRPIANAEIYVLDRWLMPVPIGVPGEIFIGGVVLARGYIRRPGLTADRFVPNPFAAMRGARMYRTGDRACWRSDGSLTFLGRIDDQVKIRGHRVEPAEIEARLADQPGVQAAAVMAKHDRTGSQRLVAYVVTAEGGPTTTALRGQLREQLPDYMVPSAFVVLDKLPLSPNGKVNRLALPEPGSERPSIGSPYVSPRSDNERTICSKWAEILGVNRVGAEDDFFELGGHSLQAAQAAARVSAALGIDVTVRLLLVHRTAAALAAAIENAQHTPPIAPTRTRHSESPTSTSHPRNVTEQRAVMSEFAAGNIAKVDAGAIGYLPDSLVKRNGLERSEIKRAWGYDMPTLHAVRETPVGRIATFVLPRFASELYVERSGLIQLIVTALDMARDLGARAVSLTGLLPSATDYGRAIARTLVGRDDLPSLTTGHGTTTAAVVLTVERTLELTGRHLQKERLGCVGLGSIGLTSLRLLLRCLPHPQEITICDVYTKHADLEILKEDLHNRYRYSGRITVADAGGADAIYNSTLIIGATNVAAVLNVDLLKPGTIVIDDSAPHCFDVEAALERLRSTGDILPVEGGILRSPAPIGEVFYSPPSLQFSAETSSVRPSYHSTSDITGCVLSAALSAMPKPLDPTLGMVDDSAALQHVDTLRRLHFSAGDLRCAHQPIDEEFVTRFRRRFGRGGQSRRGTGDSA